MNTIVETWFVVEHSDGYEIGQKHKTKGSAALYRDECVDKRRRKKCRVVKFKLTKTIVA